MKGKSFLLFLTALVAVLLCSCGNSNADASSSAPGISQSEYDALKNQNEDLKTENDRLKTENDRLTGELKKANTKIEELQNNEVPTSAAPTEAEVLVHDDDYVTISFIGCEMDQDDQNLVFMVANHCHQLKAEQIF